MAERLNVSPDFVRKLERAGQLPAVWLGRQVVRYPAAPIERLVNGDD